MSREWKPGAVALVEAGCWANRKIALRLADGWSHVNGVNVDGDGIVSPVRRLVVIDAEDAPQMESLAKAWDDLGDGYFEPGPKAMSLGAYRMQAALRSLIEPPKPEEPTDPTTRVTDRRDNIWRLLADGEWVCTSGPDIGEYLVWDQLAEDRGPVSIEVTA